MRDWGRGEEEYTARPTAARISSLPRTRGDHETRGARGGNSGAAANTIRVRATSGFELSGSSRPRQPRVLSF